MSYGTHQGSILRPFEVIVHEFVCDATGCTTYLKFVTSDEDGDLLIQAVTNYGEELDLPDDATYIMTEDDAITVAVEHYRWQEGTCGVQRGHLYCPKHRYDQHPTPSERNT